MFRYTILFISVLTFLPVFSQTELKSIEKCDILFKENSGIELPMETVSCAYPPEGYFFLGSNEELLKFYSSYPTSQAACNTYQLPKINFDTCKALFYRISFWAGTQIQKQFYLQNATMVFILKLNFRAKDINSTLNYDMGYYIISKKLSIEAPKIYTCHKQMD